MRTIVRRTRQWLSRHYPVNRPIIVKIVEPQEGLHGLCILSPDRVLIRISRASENVMAETLIEEYCHVLRDDCPVPYNEGEEHDAIFWAILGKVSNHWRGET